MRRILAAGLLALAACGAERASEPLPPAEGEALFVDMLAEHQALNRRVERVGYRLLTANADLCERTERTLGLSVHTVSDYPKRLRPLARHMLGVDEGISVRSVVAEGPANAAGLRSGDAIRRVDEMPVMPSSIADRVWRIVERRFDEADDVTLRILRDGRRLDVPVPTVQACASEIDILFSEMPNAHTDGIDLFITSELVRLTESDARLALVLAHELAHVLLHAENFLPGPDKELEADALGLMLMHRAGYDMHAGIDEMESFARNLRMGVTGSHPLHTLRVSRLRDFAADVEAGDAGLEDVLKQ